jgi:hypothetical protein
MKSNCQGHIIHSGKITASLVPAATMKPPDHPSGLEERKGLSKEHPAFTHSADGHLIDLGNPLEPNEFRRQTKGRSHDDFESSAKLKPTPSTQSARYPT